MIHKKWIPSEQNIRTSSTGMAQGSVTSIRTLSWSTDSIAEVQYLPVMSRKEDIRLEKSSEATRARHFLDLTSIKKSSRIRVQTPETHHRRYVQYRGHPSLIFAEVSGCSRLFPIISASIPSRHLHMTL